MAEGGVDVAVVDKQILGRTLMVKLSGELDLVTAESARLAIDGDLDEFSRVRNLVFDLTDVKFIDSSGLGMLLGRYKKINDRGGRMLAFGVQPVVQRVLEMAGMTKIMGIASSLDEALAHC